jgi:anti-anti-sigma factor
MSDVRQVFSVLSVQGGLKLEGELDSATVPLAVDAFASRTNGTPELTLEVSDLTFIDSAGLHAIITFARSREPDGTITISGASPFLLRLFEITQVDRLPNLRIDVRA